MKLIADEVCVNMKIVISLYTKNFDRPRIVSRKNCFFALLELVIDKGIRQNGVVRHIHFYESE